MIKIVKQCSKELEVGIFFDDDEELEVTILSENGGDNSVWVNRKEVIKLMKHLQNILLKEN